MNQAKEIEEMAKELHCATNESFISCRKIARILVERRGYRLCGGEDCPNFKHYQAECKRCTKKMEVKKSFEIESAVQQAVKEFAEKFREQLEQYRLDNEYFTADEPNGNLWQMNSSVFYLEVIDKGGLIDELVKGYNNDD